MLTNKAIKEFSINSTKKERTFRHVNQKIRIQNHFTIFPTSLFILKPFAEKLSSYTV